MFPLIAFLTQGLPSLCLGSEGLLDISVSLHNGERPVEFQMMLTPSFTSGQVGLVLGHISILETKQKPIINFRLIVISSHHIIRILGVVRT